MWVRAFNPQSPTRKSLNETGKARLVNPKILKLLVQHPKYGISRFSRKISWIRNTFVFRAILRKFYHADDSTRQILLLSQDYVHTIAHIKNISNIPGLPLTTSSSISINRRILFVHLDSRSQSNLIIDEIRPKVLNGKIFILPILALSIFSFLRLIQT